MNPDFSVPADFFYALAVNTPGMSPADQLTFAVSRTESQLYAQFLQAIDAGTIGSMPGGISPLQAARRLAALGAARSTAPGYTIGPASGPPSEPQAAQVYQLVGAAAPAESWLSDQGPQPPGPLDTTATDAALWQTLLAGTPPPVTANQQAQLRLVVCALTGWDDPQLSQFVSQLTSMFNVQDADDLANLTGAQWEAFFAAAGNASLLPAFLEPPSQTVSESDQVQAFLRFLTQFYTVKPAAGSVTGPAPGAVPVLDRYGFDPLQAFLAAYDAANATPYAFGTSSPDDAAAQNAIAAVFPSPFNAAAAAWLAEVLRVLHDLAAVTAGLVPASSPNAAALEFSIMEGLYARGFTSTAQIAALDEADFASALTGSVAWQWAQQIWTNAGGTGQPAPPAPGPFQPVNPDGTLASCIPPPELSPLGPVAYLSELLQAGPSSTCEQPATDGDTFGTLLAARRGQLGSLQATRANLETPLPAVDLVNECLENLAGQVASGGGTASSPSGVVYDTSGDKVGDHLLRPPGSEPEPGLPYRHDPATLFAAVAEHSSPASPVAEPSGYAALAADFSAPGLPYSQPLDVSRRYLGQAGTTRFETMRRLRAEITEFVLAPDPTGFDPALWRYPVRSDIAPEYLHIGPDEYRLLYATPIATSAPGTSGQLLLWQMYGYPEPTLPGGQPWEESVAVLGEFLRRTGLSYCEFLELWECGLVPIQRGTPPGEDDAARSDSTAFEPCEPCYLDKVVIDFGGEDTDQVLMQLAVFIRLWRTLQRLPGAGYSFTQLSDIASVLGLFQAGAVNAGFIPQLAAFQMLRDELGLPLGTSPEPGKTGAERTRLLGLWEREAAPDAYQWAAGQLVAHLEGYTLREHGCRRRPGMLAELAANLDPLSVLGGFTPGNPPDTWDAEPTHTLRFAEILARLYASPFSVGDVEFLFTSGRHLHDDDPFPLQGPDQAADDPLGLPAGRHALRELRRQLLDARIGEDELERWDWWRIDAFLRHELGYNPAPGSDPLLSLAQHAFPGVLERQGHPVPPPGRLYRTALPASSTSSATWNSDPDSPFRYDPGTDGGELWTRLPLPDETVLDMLTRTPQLNPAECDAVQDLYFQPRDDLAGLGFLFGDQPVADYELLQQDDDQARWAFFRRHVALTHRRCRIIAEYLARGAASGRDPDEREIRRAHLVLKELAADENLATSSWEGGQPAGTPPELTWPVPAGGAYAALLGLCGTGLLGEYQDQDGTVLWRDFTGSLRPFGHVRDRWNAPLPTVIPSLQTPPSPAGFADIRNGIAIDSGSGERLGGAQGFTAQWAGVLLIERAGRHRFSAGAPTPDGQPPEVMAARQASWHITLARGSRTWVLLSHGWAGRPDTGDTGEADLQEGAYDITISFRRAAPDFSHPEELHPQRTGFQVKYAGPDTGEQLISLPHHRLLTRSKDAALDYGIQTRPEAAARAALRDRYTSTLRDIRRTYQRAFKAVMLVSRFGLDAPHGEEGQSELGYFLGHPDRFAGLSFYREPPVSGGFVQHQAQLDLNFLPVLDDYDPPPAGQDQRADPTPQRQAALFDWWERLFEYALVRRSNRGERNPSLWWLFQTASETPPSDPAKILPYLQVEPGHVNLVQTYYGLQGLLGRPELTAQDLLNERWAMRIWRAEQWARGVDAGGAEKGLAGASADLWAADDPSAGSPSGNTDLVTFVQDALIEDGDPRRYLDLQRLDDRLRENARAALLAYLCRMNRVELPFLPAGTYATATRQLTDLLLLDVGSGMCERASRIDNAISAVQAFVLRARLGLEPGVELGPAFRALWDGRFASFRTWQACKRRELYPENWIERDELERARRHEGFRFLEENLRQADLSLPVPAGIQYWDDPGLRRHPGLPVLQAAVPSTLHLPVPAETQPADAAVPTENFGLLGRPDWAGTPSWLSAVGAQPPGTTQPPPPPPPRTQLRPAVSQPPAPPDATADEAPASPDAAAPEAPASPDAAAPDVIAQQPPSSGPAGPLPWWIEAAVGLGARFLRVAAAGEPAGSSLPEPRPDESCCCADCGRIHPPVTDEYYFWLAGAEFYDLPPAQDGDLVNASGQSSWEDPIAFPQLLAWSAEPMAYLYWCRVRCGEFGQLRRSSEGVLLDPALLGSPPAPPTLELRGRVADSLVFVVDGGVVPASLGGPGISSGSGGSGGSGFDWQGPYQGWNAESGWRYDLARDDAELLPLVTTPTPPSLLPASLPDPATFAGLAAYPFFVYFAPGASLVPLSAFAPAVTVAGALRAHCRFEAALRWYALYYDAQQGDNTWSQCPKDKLPGRTAPTVQLPAAEGDCCQNTPPTPAVARRRGLILDTLDTLLCWGDAVMTEHRGCAQQGGGAPESFAQARVIFDAASRILGPDPVTVLLPDPGTPPPTVGQFQSLPAPLNPRLIALYQRVADRLRLIHECDRRSRLRYGKPGADMSYWGDDPARDGWRITTWTCCDPDHWCDPRSPYRFTFLIQRALELAGEVQAFGSALLSAIEKSDAEALGSLRATQEHRLLRLGLAAREDQYRDADWQVQALKQSLLSAQNQLAYYTGLVSGGLNTGESLYQDLMGVAIPLEITGQVMEGIAELGGTIPDTYVGTGFFTKIPMTGSSFTDFFTSTAKAASYGAQDAQTGASLSLTEGGFDRRTVEWRHQMDIYSIEIEQIQRQILGAERREDAALHDVNVQQQQIEDAAEVDDFLRSKFTSQGLYLFYQRRCAIMHRQLYELAIETARQAEHAYNYERGDTAARFIEPELWSDLRQGLLAGERLQVELSRMNKAYLDRNKREYELTKHVSLKLQAPEQYLQLRRTGHCEIDLPEWLYDQDYPGQYMRRIKTVALSLPCVVGPYTGVHCRLTLLASSTRIDPRLTGRAHGCCDGQDRCECDNLGYLPLPEDNRIVREYLAREAIATSSGRADSGLFEVNFGDDRYLPFEFAGAVSRWRLELPPEDNFFDLSTLTDAILHVSYTAREGGDALRRAARKAADCHLPGNGLRVFDVRNELPEYLRRAYRDHDAECGQGTEREEDRREHHGEGRDEGWDQREDPRGEHRKGKPGRQEPGSGHDQPWQLDLRFSRSLFPFLPGRRDLRIAGLQIIFEAPDAWPGRYRILRMERRTERAERGRGRRGGRDGLDVTCVVTERWPGCYTGFIPEHAIRGDDGQVRPDSPAYLGVLVFPDDLKELGEVFLFCSYDARPPYPWSGDMPGVMPVYRTGGAPSPGTGGPRDVPAAATEDKDTTND